MSPAARKIHQDIQKLLDSAFVPKGDYKEFLEEVASDCECRLDCIREEEKGASDE